MLTKYSIKTASSVVKRTDWSYFGAESLFAKLRVLKTSVGFFAYLIASSFKYSVTCLWASLGGKPSCSSADFNKLLSLSGSIKYGFIYFSYSFFIVIPSRYYRTYPSTKLKYSGSNPLSAAHCLNSSDTAP
jgi:hypothetical protein